MSQENVEVVRASIEAFNRGDLTAALARVHPEVEVIEDPRVPGGSTLRGHAEVQRWFESLARYWESIRLVPDRLVDCGDNVLVLTRMITRTCERE
jgi:ketosteroid isomerase-like protein